MDIACEEEFEEWLRDERQSITAARERSLFAQPAQQRRSTDVPRRAAS
jgi:hypothetical protein